ncbi:Kinase associated protein B [Caldalkalibacillus thermarum TA2.A1]|uniref:Kinase associated protein B n=1 Tax=Caldalkalibacillus thermarum (strain TA2.A1) TaxID=986075 RepID=F5L5I6_CALTT|nr:kinase-associated lipoprotein B [Caldalkalibacillus thermarum]EGL83384.1 Kinase associated protein B [Caldalkalibacillus thermarum TA2.A1]QZT34543.1 kinase-associated lipoprotein B [Caldalkalibacillus thermarum TA2.A1]
MDTKLNKGAIVKAVYKTGVYIGEITELKPDRGKAVVKVLAVLKHPMQGDLHQPFQAEVPLFHQRKALAYGEQANIPLSHLSPYEGDIPDYITSLHTAIDAEINALEQQGSPWAQQAVKHLKQLKAEY